MLVFVTSIDRHNAVVLLVPTLIAALLLTKSRPAISFITVGLASVVSFFMVSQIVNWHPGEVEPEFNAPAGLNFYVGNNEKSNGGYTSVTGLRDDLYGHRIQIGPFTESLAGEKLTREEVSAYWIGRSFQFIAEQPDEYALLQLKKLALLLSQYTYGSPEQLAAWRSDSTIFSLALIDYSVLLALAFIGACVGWNTHRAQVLLLASLFYVYAGSVWIFFVTERYKLPLYSFLIPVSAYGARHIIGMQPKRMLRYGMIGLIIGVLSVNANRVMEYGYGWPEDHESYRENLTSASRRLEPIHEAMGALSVTPSPEDYLLLINLLRTPFYMEDVRAITYQGLNKFPGDLDLLATGLSIGIQLQDHELVSVVRACVEKISNPSPELQRIRDRIERYDRRLGIQSNSG